MRSAFRALLAGVMLCWSCFCAEALNVGQIEAQGASEGKRQSLRQSVCVVYPEFTAEDSVLLCKYAMMLVREGKSLEARQTRGRVRGAFGSGVVTERCVLTNRHVVCYARTAKLVFELPDTTLIYEHCPILSSSAEADLAAIALPDAGGTLVSLPLSAQPVVEDEDITAAGFPGLQNQPSWQLTRGSVSNAHLKLPEEKRAYIQHTAAIDPGSSGGPLLRKQGKGYEVLGLNTLKAFAREQVGIAIPNEDLRRFLGSLSTPDTSDFALMDTIAEQLRAEQEWMEETLHSPGLEPYMRDIWQATLAENWTFSGEHMLDASIDFYTRFYVTGGFSLSAPIVPKAGFAGGFRFGGFVPIRIYGDHFLLPQATVGVQVGLLFPKTGPMVYIPVRAGVDYRYEFSKTALVLGVYYVFRPTVNAMSGGDFALQHGLSVRAGVAF